MQQEEVTTDTVTQDWIQMFGSVTDLRDRMIELDKAVPMNNKRSQYGGYGPTTLDEVKVKTDEGRIDKYGDRI
jgi:hypothetical protein